MGLLRLTETRLDETTIGRKPQLADFTISRNHDWPKAQISGIFVVFLFYFLCVTVLFTLELSKKSLWIAEWLNNFKNNSIARKNPSSWSSFTQKQGSYSIDR
jgi:hypothetical protein